jgi:hypothetical protein
VRLLPKVQSLRLTKPGHAFVLVAAIAILLLALVALRLTLSAPSYKVATWSRPAMPRGVPEARALTKVGGVLGGRANADGTACFWLGGDALVWPPRYSARGNPLTIVDENGVAVAQVGQWINLDGSVAAPEDMQAKPVLGCPKMSSVELAVR